MKRGFTLIELLVVVLIIGILSAVALPQYQKSVDKANAIEMKNFINAYSKAQKLYFLQNNSYSSLEDLESTGIKMPELKNFEITPNGSPGIRGTIFFTGKGVMSGVIGTITMSTYSNSTIYCRDSTGKWRCAFFMPCDVSTNTSGSAFCINPW